LLEQVVISFGGLIRKIAWGQETVMQVNPIMEVVEHAVHQRSGISMDTVLRVRQHYVDVQQNVGME
jgi:hypothetical protein